MNQISSVYAVSIPNQLVLSLIVIVSVVFLVKITCHYWYKGRIRQITVVNLRSSERNFINFSYTKFNKSNYATLVHQTVDIHYAGSIKTHTLNCDSHVFERLHIGKTYTVLIRFGTIKKIV